MPAILNHLWYCVSTCHGSADVLKVKWMSLLYHISNRHEWGLALGAEMHRCDHDKYSIEEERKRSWIREESEAFKKLQKIVLSKDLLQDLEKVKIHICTLHVVFINIIS